MIGADPQRVKLAGKEGRFTPAAWDNTTSSAFIGIFATGSIQLRSKVTLALDAGALLRAAAGAMRAG